MEHTGSYVYFEQKLNELCTFYKKYSLPCDQLDKYMGQLDQFQVVIPIIGEFSTGKSSIINALLKKNYLGVNLSPETSVPTEICCGRKEYGVVFDRIRDSIKPREISIQEFLESEFSALNVKKVQLFLQNDFLSSISTVKLVDMPGFHSTFELHDHAISDYLPESLAYIITFSAREPVMSADMVNFLRELKLHEIPVYLLITKCESVLPSELNQCISRIREDAKKYLGIAEAKVYCTNARGKKIITEPLKEILMDAENQSQSIFVAETKKFLNKCISESILYLETSIKQINAMPSELEAQEENCERQLEHLRKKLQRAREDFSTQIEHSITNIRSRINKALNNSSSSLETMLINGMDIRDKINYLVREAVLSSIKDDFTPRLQQYVEKIADIVKLDLNIDTNVQINEAQLQMDSAIRDTIKKSLPIVLAAIGRVLGGPIGAIVGVIGGLIVDIFFSKKQQNDQRRIARVKVQGELIPQITEKATNVVNEKIHEQIDEITSKIDEEVKQKIEIQEKALSDLRTRYAEEQTVKNEKLVEMQTDLESIKKLLQEVK